MNNKNINDESKFNYMKETVMDKSKTRRKRVRNILLSLISLLVLIIILISIKNPPNTNDLEKEKLKETDNALTPIEIIVTDESDIGNMDIEDYRAIYNNLKEAGESTGKYIVTVTSINSDDDWLASYMENEGVTSGLITSINDEICILTNYETVTKADKIMVKFLNGDIVQGKLLKADTSSGIAIICVESNKLDEETLEIIGVASFGDVTRLETGDPIIIVGNPYGDNHYMNFGELTSTTGHISATDDIFRLLATNVAISGNADGFIINLEGEIVGFLSPINFKDSLNKVISGIAISDIRSIIDKLSLGENIPHIGITGQEITDEIIELVQEDMPYGIYVKSVDINSPAYYQGIVSGDIIVELNEKKTKSLKDYSEILRNKNVGDEISITINRKGRNGYYEYKYTLILGSR